MFWKFWKNEKTEAGEERLPGPKGIPFEVGRHLVVEENKDANLVWKLKGLVRPTKKKKAFYCRVFDETKAAQAGVKVKDWNSLDEHLDLIFWEGSFDKETNMARTETFVKP
jgi:hypothetical protein